MHCSFQKKNDAESRSTIINAQVVPMDVDVDINFFCHACTCNNGDIYVIGTVWVIINF